jgi:hypothetical protein
MSYYRSYYRGRYVFRKVRRDLLARLYSWCGGESVNLCLERLLDYASPATTTTNACGVLVDTVVELARAVPQLRPLLVELLTNAGARLAERELLRRGMVARLVVELSRGLLALDGRDVVLSPVLRRLLDSLGCGDALVRALQQ